MVYFFDIFMENTLVLRNGNAKLFLSSEDADGFFVVAAEGGIVEPLNEEAALFVDDETQKSDLVDLKQAKTVAGNVFEVEKLGDGRILFGIKDSKMFFMYGGNNTHYLGRKHEGGAYFCQGVCFAWRELTDRGAVYHLLEYDFVGKNELNSQQIVCRKMYSKDYDVYWVNEVEGRKYLRRSQASLIYCQLCRFGGEEFVLHFNPYKGDYELISLRRPSMRRRCSLVFANENFVVKNPKSYNDFMAPRTLGEVLYDIREQAASWWDELYIKVRYNCKWMW